MIKVFNVEHGRAVGRFHRGIETIRKKSNGNAGRVAEVKSPFDGLVTKLDIAEERQIEITHSEAPREKKSKK